MPIVTIPPGITGPALQTTQVINAKWDNAVGWFNQAFDFGAEAMGQVGTAPVVQQPNVLQNFDLVDPPSDLSFDDPTAAMAYFDAKNSEISAQIDGAFRSMLGEAFPDMSTLAEALAWCRRAITQGGTGINSNVEAALWERGRARILRQADRDMASTTERYARAGWPLPPGAMLHDTALIRQDSRDKLAEQSRDIAVKSFETEVENVRFAVGAVSDMYTKAIAAVGEYVKAIALGPQLAAQLSTSMSGLKNEAARTLVALYQAQNAAIDPLLRLSITDAELKTRVAEANARLKQDTAQMRVQTVLANVKMMGDSAAASLNGIGAGVSNTMSTSVMGS